MNTEKLVRMANQIAANLAYGTDPEPVAGAVADHLRRFWNSSMLEAIVRAHDTSTSALSPIATRAVEKLREQGSVSPSPSNAR